MLGGEQGAMNRDSWARATSKRARYIVPLPVQVLGLACSKWNSLFFPEAHDASVVEVFGGGTFDVVVGFTGGGSGGEGYADLIGEVEGEAEVFVHEAQGKAGLAIAAEHARRFDIENAGAGHGGLHDFDEFFARKAGTLNEGEGFRESLHFDSEERVHRELDGLSGAVGAEMKKFLAHGTEDGACRFEGGGIAADHEDEFAFFRTPGAAGDRRVEEANSGSGRGSRDFSGEGGRDSAGVDVDDAFFERREGRFVAAIPEDFFESGWVADDCEKYVGSGGDFVRRSGALCAGSDERIGTRGGAIPDDERKARLEKIVAHGKTHEAQTD